MRHEDVQDRGLTTPSVPGGVSKQARRPVLAIDLGGTQLRAAYITADLRVEHREAVPTHDEEGVGAVISRIARLALSVLDAARGADLPDPIGVGISSPGPLDPWRGVVIAPPNLSGWRDVPLTGEVERSVGLPTFLERDTNVAVLAEWRDGAAAGAQTVIYSTISTGIGGGIVVDGRPLVGRDGTAGEIGHMTVEIDGPLCGDGQPGHAEAIGSGTAIARAGRELVDAGGSQRLASMAAGEDGVSAKLVARAAAAGDAACAAIMERAYRAVGVMCAGLVNVLNPEVIVLGGSIAEHQPRLRQVAREEIDRRSFPIPARRVRVAEPRFGDDVSLVGASSVVNERINDASYRRSDRERPA